MKKITFEIKEIKNKIVFVEEGAITWGESPEVLGNTIYAILEECQKLGYSVQGLQIGVGKPLTLTVIPVKGAEKIAKGLEDVKAGRIKEWK